jgi:hypothetical protein
MITPRVEHGVEYALHIRTRRVVVATCSVVRIKLEIDEAEVLQIRRMIMTTAPRWAPAVGV